VWHSRRPVRARARQELLRTSQDELPRHQEQGALAGSQHVHYRLGAHARGVPNGTDPLWRAVLRDRAMSLFQHLAGKRLPGFGNSSSARLRAPDRQDGERIPARAPRREAPAMVATLRAQTLTEEAGQADRLESEFVFTISHELRTPLTASREARSTLTSADAASHRNAVRRSTAGSSIRGGIHPCTTAFWMPRLSRRRDSPQSL
jgi:signal transduction histidine kinase